MRREFKEKPSAFRSSETFFKPAVQKKLSVGKPGDKYEQEADRMADQVVNKTSGSEVQRAALPEEEVQQKPLAETVSSVQAKELSDEEPVQRQTEEKDETVQKVAEEEESVQKSAEEDEPVRKAEEDEQQIQRMEAETTEDEKLQAKFTNPPIAVKSRAKKTSVNNVESKLSESKGKGRPMQGGVKAEMESGFGSGFNDVRIHTDAQAEHMSSEMGALAFTHGKDIYFNAGQYNPDSAEGKVLLAHELTHTIQQEGSESQHFQDSNDAAIESDSVNSTEGWFGRLLKHGKDAGNKIMPKLKSGLRIARCTEKERLSAEQKYRRQLDGETREKIRSGNISFKEMDKIEKHDNKTFNSFHLARMMLYREKNWSKEGQTKGYGEEDYHDCVTSFCHTFEHLYDKPFKTFNYATVEKAKNKKGNWVDGAFENFTKLGYISDSADFIEYTKDGKAGTEVNPNVTHFKESPVTWALSLSKTQGIHVFGVSLNDGFHAMNLIIDNRGGGIPEFYLQDQHKKTDALDRSSPLTAKQVEAYFLEFSNVNSSQKGKRKVKLFKFKRVN